MENYKMVIYEYGLLTKYCNGLSLKLVPYAIMGKIKNSRFAMIPTKKLTFKEEFDRDTRLNEIFENIDKYEVIESGI